jgi:hypothetical protein
MSNIIEFKQKKKSDGFKRTDELFTVTLWVGGDDEYEIDMLTNEELVKHPKITKDLDGVHKTMCN